MFKYISMYINIFIFFFLQMSEIKGQIWGGNTERKKEAADWSAAVDDVSYYQLKFNFCSIL